MNSISSLVVSDPLASAAANAGIGPDDSGGDIVYCNWENYLDATFEQSVRIYDLNLWRYVDEIGRNDIERIAHHKSEFNQFFQRFADDIRYYLNLGDTVIIIDSSIQTVEISEGFNTSRTSHSHKWRDDLDILSARGYIHDERIYSESDIEPLNDYFSSVNQHYTYNINEYIVKNPDILARSQSDNSVAAFATSEVRGHGNQRVEADGTLIILPPPATSSKPHRLMRNLVELGWEYHDEERREEENQSDSKEEAALGVSIGELDSELVEKCWSKYARGEYRDAASRACQLLEHRVRESADIGGGLYGADLMKQSFSPHDGPLTMGEEKGEMEGAMFLYAGAVQGIWNPLHHREGDREGEKYLDRVGRQEAHDILCFVNFLLGQLPEEDS